jgi:SAM-dependent methyltransferase
MSNLKDILAKQPAPKLSDYPTLHRMNAPIAVLGQTTKRAVNVGSGQRRFHDPSGEIEWANVDKVSRPGHEPDLVCDGAHLPYEDGSADYFVLHHVLEHFGCGEASGLIKEAHRVLKLGGSLIVCVPDLRALAARWMCDMIDTQLYVTNLYGAYMGNEADRHKWGFDSKSLVTFLSGELWWNNVSRFDFRQIPGASICQDWWILGVECVK